MSGYVHNVLIRSLPLLDCHSQYWGRDHQHFITPFSLKHKKLQSEDYAAFSTWIWREMEPENRRRCSEKYTIPWHLSEYELTLGTGSLLPVLVFSPEETNMSVLLVSMLHVELDWKCHWCMLKMCDWMVLVVWFDTGTQEHISTCWYWTKILPWLRRKGVYHLNTLQSMVAGPGGEVL